MNKKYSLKKNKDIEKLVHMKKSVGNKFYSIYYLINNKEPRIAISASKKLGNAVSRNYEKRVIREIVRPLLNNIGGYDLLIVIKSTAPNLSFEEKKGHVEYLLNKIINRSWKWKITKNIYYL